MARPKVFVTRLIPEVGLEMLAGVCQADVWQEELPPEPSVLLERVRGAEGILSLLTDKIDAKVMDAAGPALKVISNCAVGFDNVDIAEATRRRIPVGNTPGVLTDTTADFAFALLMSAARRVVEGDRFTRAGRWKTWGPRLLLGQDITGATLGIIGLGRIGRGMAKRARGFDMRVLYYDPNCLDSASYPGEISARCVDLDTLYAEADFVSIHTPLTEATYHLVNAEAFRKMKPTAILINTARGPVVDPDALYRALAHGQIAGAALDVTEPEPIPLNSPLLKLENIIIAPHIGSASVATRDKMATMAGANLIAGIKGERLPHCVNPEVYG
jgi:glyoxylate reductase